MDTICPILGCVRRPVSIGLVLGVAFPYAVMVLLGVSVLVWGLVREQERAERLALEEVAATNARFLRELPMSVTPDLAARLGRVLGLEVRVGPPEGMEGAVADGKARRFGPGVWVVGVEVRAGETLWLERESRPAWAALRSPVAMLSLGGLVVLAAGLAAVVAVRVVQPLRAMASDLARPGEELAIRSGWEDRGDEIGVLARSFGEAATRLRAEREARVRSERLALLGRMSAAMAHEVHNPLASIRMHAELAAGEPGLSQGAREALSWIRSGTERIESLVNQWMFLAHPGPAVAVPVGLAALLREVLAFHAPLAADRELRLDLEADGPMESARVAGDRRRLEQAFGNVVLNAIQFAPRGSRVTVRVAPAGPGRVGVEVEDAGPGFSPEALDRWAEPFWSGRAGGTGIGLSVAREVIEGCGGVVRVSNRSSGGAVVRCEFEMV